MKPEQLCLLRAEQYYLTFGSDQERDAWFTQECLPQAFTDFQQSYLAFSTIYRVQHEIKEQHLKLSAMVLISLATPKSATLLVNGPAPSADLVYIGLFTLDEQNRIDEFVKALTREEIARVEALYATHCAFTNPKEWP